MGLAGNMHLNSLLHKLDAAFIPGGRIRFGKHFEKSRTMMMMMMALSIQYYAKHFICSMSFNYSNFPMR